MSCALITHASCALHEMGERHPESPKRLAAIEAALRAANIDSKLRKIDAPRVTREQLLRVHTHDYLNALEAKSPREGRVQLDGDTAINPYSLEAARRAAGAVVKAVDLVMSGEVRSAFCAVRPPGHHARPAASMGFCIFNNVAIGIAHSLAAHALARVAIIDFDVHHGNGTEEMFRGESRVLICDSFQSPYYPHQGTSAREGYIPVPLPAGTNGTQWRDAVGNAWLRALRAFKPQLVFFSAGFDAHAGDPLAQLQLDADDYAWLTHEVRDIAEAYAKGRIVSALEGGYHLDALGRSVVAHIKMLGDC